MRERENLYARSEVDEVRVSHVFLRDESDHKIRVIEGGSHNTSGVVTFNVN